MSWKRAHVTHRVQAVRPESPSSPAIASAIRCTRCRVAGGVWILGVDRRVQRLDRLERARLEHLVRLEQLLGAASQRDRLPAKAPRGATHEQGERATRSAAKTPATVNQIGADVCGRDGIEVIGAAVHLVGAQEAPVRAPDRRVDLERAVDTGLALGRLLRVRRHVVEILDRTVRLTRLQRLREIVADREVLADAALVEGSSRAGRRHRRQTLTLKRSPRTLHAALEGAGRAGRQP